MAKNSGGIRSRRVLGIIALAIAILVSCIAWQYMQTLQSNIPPNFPPNTTNGNSNGDTTNGDTTNGDTTNGDTTNDVNEESVLPLNEKLNTATLPLRDYNGTSFSFEDLYEDKIIIVHFVYCIAGFKGINTINEYQFGELKKVNSEYSQDITIVSVALLPIKTSLFR